MKAFRNCIFCFKTVFHYAPWNISLAIIGLVVPACFTGLQVLLIQYIVDSAMAFYNGTGELDAMMLWGVLLVIMLVMWVALQRMSYYQMNVVSIKLTEKMAPEIMKKLTELEYSSFEEQETQEVFQKMSSEPEAAVDMCCRYSITLIQACVSLIFSMAVVFAISPWIALGVILIGIPMTIMGYYVAGRQAAVTEEAADARRRMTNLKELLANKHAMLEMKLFGAEELLTRKWDDYSTKEAEITLRQNKKILLTNIGSQCLSIINMIFIIVTVAVGLLSGSLTLGQFTAALNGAFAINSRVSNCSMHMRGALHAALEVNFYMVFIKLKTRSDIGEKTSLKHYDIAFEDVSFRYPGTERDILKNVTFYVKEGERIAFVGENGAGKSTIIKLLCGLYEPTTGNVTVGGVPVRELEPAFRTSLLSVVFQDFQAYQMTLRENVAFGNLRAADNDEKLLHALQQADAEELASSNERGLERNLGKLTEDGEDLSKGQWQRVAMARAFVSDAKYVILDEPTASLDPLAESHMYENFSRIFKERGTIMISHRLASAKMADRIFVLDGGRIVQRGSHQELMDQQGLYRTMFNAQSSFYQEA